MKEINETKEHYDGEEEIVLAKAKDEPTAEEEEKEKELPKQEEQTLQKKEKAAVREGEIKELRLENRKVFRMSDGSEQAVFYPEPIHVYDAKTRAYEDIEDTIIESEDKKSFTVGKNRFKASFSNDEESDELFTIEKDGCRISAVMKRSRKKMNKGVRGHLERINKEDEFKRPKDKLSYKDVGEGADYEYTVNGNGIKENIVIKEKRDVYRYSFILETDNLEYEHLEKDRTVIFRSIDSGKEIFRIPTPFMTDAKGVNSTAVEYEVRKISDGKLSFAVMADSEWINAKSRVFPVTIDPQVIVSQNGNITTYSWDNGYMYTSATHIVGHKTNAPATCAAFSLRGRCITDDWPDNESSGNTGGSCGGNTSGNTGGNTSGNTGGNTGGSCGGNTSGNTGGNSGGNTGGSTGGNNCDGDDCSDTGCNTDDCTTSVDAMRTYININLPTLPNNPRIKKAELHFIQKDFNIDSGNYHRIGLYKANGSVGDDINNNLAVNSNLIDYEQMAMAGGNIYKFDITTLFDEANETNNLSFNLVLKTIDESQLGNDYIEIYGSAKGGGYEPTLNITYDSESPVNANNKVHAHNIGSLGFSSVDLLNGNLMFEFDDFVWSGNRMPITIKHLYNSGLSRQYYTITGDTALTESNNVSMNFGKGWKLNVMQRIITQETQVNGQAEIKYIYINDRGEQIYFKATQNEMLDPETGIHYYLYEDTEGRNMTYDYVLRHLRAGIFNYCFDVNGRLEFITNTMNNNKISYTYCNDKITAIIDGAGREFALAYNDSYNKLSSITAPDEKSINYYYSDGGKQLTRIKYSDGRSINFTYDTEGKPIEVILKEDTTQVYKIKYEYKNSRVSKVTECGVNENGNFIVGSCYEYNYSIASNRTVVTSTEQNDTETGSTETVVVKTVYNFDYKGDIVKEYSYSDNINGMTICNADGEVVINPDSFLLDGDFEDFNKWMVISNSSLFSASKLSLQDMVGDTTNNSAEEIMRKKTVKERDIKYGVSVVRLISNSNNNVASGVYQTTCELPAGEYTFSAYVRIVENISSAKAYIRVTDTCGNILSESGKLTEADSEFIRLTASFRLDSEQEVEAHILMDGEGTVYADAAQLENSPYASNFNMLDNGGFEYGTYGWIISPTGSVNYGEQDKFSMNKSLYEKGGLTTFCNAKQTVNVKSAVGTRETFTLSGWAKANALPIGYKEEETAPVFRLRAEIFYKGGERESYEAEFSPGTEDWQYTSVQFAKEQYLEVVNIQVFCDYGYNSGNAYFDNIRLVRNSIETNLTANDFEDITQEEETTQSDFTEAKDEYGNYITQTIFTKDKPDTIYRSFEYSKGEGELIDEGNNLFRETDPRGNKTWYHVNEETSRYEMIVDRCGKETSYVYDNSGRVEKLTDSITELDENNEEEKIEFGNASYSYDAFDNLTNITRGDGMEYLFKYNEFHNLESVGIKNFPNSLVNYTYKNGNGRLKEISYANGHKMTVSYNSIGQIISEKWINHVDDVEANYKYTYDTNGNIVRTLDITAGKEYNYEYEGGKLIRATEYSVTLNEAKDLVESRTLVSNIRYYYDSKNQLTRKVITTENGEVITYNYSYGENADPVAEVMLGNTSTDSIPSTKSISVTDHFGRKTSDEIQINGTGSLRRTYSYHDGQVTAEHTAKSKYVSDPTTYLVSQITYSNGRTLSYEYDAEERITKVTDVYGSTTNVTEYTYDARGQLLTETVNGTVVNTMTYDNYGNITSKNGKQYTYDSVWKDRLISYGNETVEYNGSGNPIKYRGKTTIWSKDRQLKSYGSNISYTYNASGIRTSKTIGVVKHKYLLDGTKILRETWLNNTLIPIYDNEDSVCGIIYNNTPYYFIKNLQGDVIAITNKNAAVVAKYSYDAWGVCTIVSDNTDVIATVNPFRYRSYYYDTETQFYYLQSRYYDPQVGRFINPDDTSYLNPRNINGINLYAYCENNPVMHIDPTGMFLISGSALVLGLVIGAVVGAAIGAAAVVSLDYLDDGKIFNGSVGLRTYLGHVLGGFVAGVGIGLCGTLGAGLGASWMGFASIAGKTMISISGFSAISLGLGGAFALGGFGYLVKVAIDPTLTFEFSDLLIEAGSNTLSGLLSFMGGIFGGIAGLKIPGESFNLWNNIIYHTNLTIFGVYPLKYLLSIIKNRWREVF